MSSKSENQQQKQQHIADKNIDIGFDSWWS